MRRAGDQESRRPGGLGCTDRSACSDLWATRRIQIPPREIRLHLPQVIVRVSSRRRSGEVGDQEVLNARIGALAQILGSAAHSDSSAEIRLHLPQGDCSRVFSQEIRRVGDQEVLDARIGALAQMFGQRSAFRFLRGDPTASAPGDCSRVFSQEIRTTGEVGVVYFTVLELTWMFLSVNVWMIEALQSASQAGRVEVEQESCRASA